MSIERPCESFTNANKRCPWPALYPMSRPDLCTYHWRHGRRKRKPKKRAPRVLRIEQPVEVSQHTSALLRNVIEAINQAMDRQSKKRKA